MFLLTLKEARQLQTIHLMKKLVNQFNYKFNQTVNKMLICQV